MGLEFTPGQSKGRRMSYKWFRDQTSQLFELSGLPGTGKSTIAHTLVADLELGPDEVVFATFTGKAALVLSRKGCPAKTIHSIIYELRETNVLDENGNVVTRNGRAVTKPRFVKRECLENPKIKLIIIDEGGFINEKMGRDLMSFGLPILVLGDIRQLPPIYGDSFFLKEPDIELTEITRQAEGSPIIHISHAILKNERLDYGNYGSSRIITPDEVRDEDYLNHEIVICGKNKTREEINNHIKRDILHKMLGQPSIGDKIICRKNNWAETIGNGIFLVNGLQGYIEAMDKESMKNGQMNIDFRPDFIDIADPYFTNLPIDLDFFNIPLCKKSPMGNPYNLANKFELGYAITCHLSQGSEYESVLLNYEWMGDKEFMIRWFFTAVTRAADRITIAKPKPKYYFTNYNIPEVDRAPQGNRKGIF